MPLIQGKSKKSFGKNVEAEMSAGKPQKQSLAIAYNIQNKNKRKKMASGGVAISAKDEARADADDAATSEDLNMKRQSRGEGSFKQNNMVSSRASADNADTEEEMRMLMAEGGIVEDLRKQRMYGIDDARSERELNMKHQSRGEGSPTPIRAASSMPTADNARDEEDLRMMMADGGMADIDDHAGSIAEAIMRKRHAKKMADGGMVDLEANSREDKNNEDDDSYDALLKEQYDDDQISDQPKDSNEHGDDIESDAHDMLSKIRAKLRMKRNG